MRVNTLSPNASKAEYMIIGHKWKTKVINTLRGLKLNNSEINWVSKPNLLGVTVDENLKWDKQFKSAKNKICGGDCFNKEVD